MGTKKTVGWFNLIEALQVLRAFVGIGHNISVQSVLHLFLDKVGLIKNDCEWLEIQTESRDMD